MGAAILIQVWQIKKIWAISKAIGIDRDDVHAMAGAESLTQLTVEQANEVISRLQKLQGSIYKKASNKQHDEVAGGATAAQQKKVWALMYELQQFDTSPSASTIGERLCGIIRKELKTDCIPAKPFIWIDFDGCNKLIEALKRYVRSATKRKTGDF